MKERPILFSAPMVRALLDGSKTQTRRVMRHQVCAPGIVQMAGPGYCEIVNEYGAHIPGWTCTYGQPGDGLYVRETWAHDARSLEECRAAHEDAMGGGTYGPYYRATESAPETLQWRPSIHMPRWASRILLEIVSVRVERLNDCSGDDAKAEGVTLPKTMSALDMDAQGRPNSAYQHCYKLLWESINGAGSWDANPWVWVIEFRRLTT